MEDKNLGLKYLELSPLDVYPYTVWKFLMAFLVAILCSACVEGEAIQRIAWEAIAVSFLSTALLITIRLAAYRNIAFLRQKVAQVKTYEELKKLVDNELVFLLQMIVSFGIGIGYFKFFRHCC